MSKVYVKRRYFLGTEADFAESEESGKKKKKRRRAVAIAAGVGAGVAAAGAGGYAASKMMKRRKKVNKTVDTKGTKMSGGSMGQKRLPGTAETAYNSRSNKTRKTSNGTIVTPAPQGSTRGQGFGKNIKKKRKKKK